MTPPANRFLSNPPRRLVFLCGLALVAVIGYLDWITDPDFQVAVFYIIPVALTAWFLGKAAGFVIAALSIAAYLAGMLFSGPVYSNPLIPYWNAAMRSLLFWWVIELLSAWRGVGKRLEALVHERTAELREQIAEGQRAKAALHKLGAQLAEAQDAERRQVAYDIHDGLSQNLSLVKINLEAAAQESSQGLHPSDRLADLVRMINDLIKQTRTLTFELHPAMLDDLGLVPTLHWYAEQFQWRTKVEVTITEVGQRRPLATAICHYLFRAIKELSNNAVKHGQAKEIIIAIHWSPAGLRIVIDDDGRGLAAPPDPADRPPRGLGLAGIRERVASLAGQVYVESEQGQGTRIILEIPLAQPA